MELEGFLTNLFFISDSTNAHEEMCSGVSYKNRESDGNGEETAREDRARPFQRPNARRRLVSELSLSFST